MNDIKEIRLTYIAKFKERDLENPPKSVIRYRFRKDSIKFSQLLTHPQEEIVPTPINGIGEDYYFHFDPGAFEEAFEKICLLADRGLHNTNPFFKGNCDQSLTVLYTDGHREKKRREGYIIDPDDLEEILQDILPEGAIETLFHKIVAVGDPRPLPF